MTISSIVRRPSSASIGLPLGPARGNWLRIIGPAFAVSIGYVDPGNWATDVAAGTFGYRLLWVVLFASAIALVLQLAVAEFTLAGGTPFGEAIARRWPRAKVALCFAFGSAAVATDVCEFAGIVLGLELLLRLPLAVAVATGIAIVFITLRTSDAIVRGLEIGAIAALALITCACFGQLVAIHPSVHAMLAGAVPSVPGGALVVIVGIVGATVMPHNLFLHSALVKQSVDASPAFDRRRVGRIFRGETIVALAIATIVNVVLVVVGASFGGGSATLQHAFALLAAAGGVSALLFGGGLLLSGIAASTTATAAGDGIFAAFMPQTFPRLARRAITLLPAAVLLLLGCDIGALLLWSQVALAIVLPVAIVPLVLLLREGRRSLRLGTTIVWAAAFASLVCIAFDVVMVGQILLVPAR